MVVKIFNVKHLYFPLGKNSVGSKSCLGSIFNPSIKRYFSYHKNYDRSSEFSVDLSMHESHLAKRSFPLFRPTSICIIKRTMMTSLRNLTAKVVTTLSHGTPNPMPPSIRSYATYSVNPPDSNTKDVQAVNNNPRMITKTGKVIHHKELVRKLCDQPGCIGSFCMGLCGKISSTPKSIAHVTHGQSDPTETDKHTAPISKTDFNGKPKQQNGVFYDKPHDSTNDTQDEKATQRLNTDLEMQQAIKDHENKS
jgi:hypothetical protein